MSLNNDVEHDNYTYYRPQVQLRDFSGSRYQALSKRLHQTSNIVTVIYNW